MTTHTIYEGENAAGVTERTHFEDDSIVIQKTFDAQPHLEYAQQARESTAGQGWGNGRMIGHIPPAFYGQLLLIEDPKDRQKAVMTFLRENPAFVMFDRALK